MVGILGLSEVEGCSVELAVSRYLDFRFIKLARRWPYPWLPRDLGLSTDLSGEDWFKGGVLTF